MFVFCKKNKNQETYKWAIPEVRDNTSQHQLVAWYQPAANLQKEIIMLYKQAKRHTLYRVLIIKMLREW